MELTEFASAFLDENRRTTIQSRLSMIENEAEARRRGSLDSGLIAPEQPHILKRKINSDHPNLKTNYVDTLAPREVLSKQDRKSRKIIDEVSTRIAQKRKNIRQCFFEINANKNGKITYDEFRKGLKHLGVDLNNQDFTMLVNAIDSNYDHMIDYQEFADAMKGDLQTNNHEK
jgi:hypothetical protein